MASVQAQDNTITVLTTNSPLIYNKHKRGEPFGIDHDLIQNFAKYYDIKVKYVVLPNQDAVQAALARGEGDVAAARFRTPEANTGFLVGPAYEETSLSLYCLAKKQVQNIADLSNRKIALLKKDNYRGLSQRLMQLAPLTDLNIIADKSMPDLLLNLSKKEYDCVVAETFTGDFYARYYPAIEKVTQLTEAYSLSWLISPNRSDLLQLMQSWYQQAAREDEIMRVLDRYRTYLVQLDKRDIRQFLKLSRSVLPRYKKTFKQASLEHGLPWQLVASVAYQESHWNPDARSFTGVLGLMQLTTETALHLGVEDRTDPEQSIRGGSKYLRYLLNKMPRNLNHKDRVSLALAAYNIGYAHLRDAQKLAVRMGRNPHSWRHLREILPLLADPAYASELEYGPARGYETVDFVERVKSFYTLMNSTT